MRRISLIPYSCGAGADNKTCADGANSLRKGGLADLLKKNNIDAEWLNPIETNDIDRDNASIVAAHCNNLKNQVQDVLKSDGFPVTIGGDHSMAIGTWSGVAEALNIRRDLGLIWVDAHMDAHTAITSPTGNRHGMPVSYLLGYGDDKLADITKREPIISPNHLCFIGIRSFETEEAAFLKKLGVRVFAMDEIRERGLDAVMIDAVKIVSEHTDGFGISVDIDAFDPEVAPGTGTLEKGGLFKEEFTHAAQNALAGYKDKLIALEIAEYNPHLDKNNITVNLVADILAAVI